MRLTRIQIEGFGSLQGMDLRFGPAMNLVVGPNEAGKSTLQEAIVTGLYGLHSSNSARTTLVERADRWRPWQGGDFGLALEFELEDGSQLRVERDLDAETVRVTDIGTGADLSERFDHDAAGDVQLGRQLLGVSRDIYTNTACISRSEVMRLEDAGSIKAAIAALAEPPADAHPFRHVSTRSPGRRAGAAQPSARDARSARGVRPPRRRVGLPGAAARGRAAEARRGGSGP